MQDYLKQHERMIKKISKFTECNEITQVFQPTRSFPVHLYCETKDGLRFYIECSIDDGWQVDYTRDSNVLSRTNMYTIRGFKNQDEVLKFVERIIQDKQPTLFSNGKVY